MKQDEIAVENPETILGYNTNIQVGRRKTSEQTARTKMD